MEATITEILEPMQERTSKAGKTYRAMKVELEVENGETARTLSFDELELGAMVKVEKKGEYWSIVTPKRGVDLTPVLDAIKFVAEQNKEILRLMKLSAPSGRDQARAVADSLKVKDEVYEPTDEELNEYEP